MKGFVFGAWVGLMTAWSGTNMFDWRWWVIVFSTCFMGIWAYHDLQSNIEKEVGDDWK